MAPKLPELAECLDNTLKDVQGGVVGVSLQLDPMIPVGPFPVRMFCDF